jgi:hypothetical protein
MGVVTIIFAIKKVNRIKRYESIFKLYLSGFTKIKDGGSRRWKR